MKEESEQNCQFWHISCKIHNHAVLCTLNTKRCKIWFLANYATMIFHILVQPLFSTVVRNIKTTQVGNNCLLYLSEVGNFWQIFARQCHFQSLWGTREIFSKFLKLCCAITSKVETFSGVLKFSKGDILGTPYKKAFIRYISNLLHTMW